MRQFPNPVVIQPSFPFRDDRQTGGAASITQGALRFCCNRMTARHMEITPVNPVIASAFQRQTLAAFAIDNGYPFDTDYFAFAAVNKNKVIGTIDGYTLYDWAYVTFLAVDPKQRGNGVGSKLLSKVENDM
ncbi:MAG: GNAT family N-acetyltransferase, partial [Roseivivax sp.]|nr:GNAT family N-acetyltransferase [Roseivivax sp.]